MALQTECEIGTARVADLLETVTDKDVEIKEQSDVIQELMAEASKMTSENLKEEGRLKQEVARRRAEREKDVQAAQAEVRN